MPARLPSFRVYVLGRLSGHYLTILAEFQDRRAVAQISVDELGAAALADRVGRLRGFIATRLPSNYDEAELRNLGRVLYSAIVRDNVELLYVAALGSEATDRPFEIFVEDPELAGWPWEYLYDAGRTKFVCHDNTAISRGIFTLRPRLGEKSSSRPLRMLVVIAVQLNDKSATAAEELQWLKDLFETYHRGDEIAIEFRECISAEQFSDELSDEQYDIVHFYGHGRFDEATQKGHVMFERPGARPDDADAEVFADLFQDKQVSLVFLNACETGTSSAETSPAISSVAAALVNNGVAAVIATQFPMPATTAPYLSSRIYKTLLKGRSLLQAMREGRRALRISSGSTFFDWGIPIVYATVPDLVLFPGGPVPTALGSTEPVADWAKTTAVPATAQPRRDAKCRVALVDFDSQVNFLPVLVERVNAAQDFYQFKVAYLPMPVAAFRTFPDHPEPQMYIPALEDFLRTKPEELGVDRVLCLTNRMVSGVDGPHTFWNHIADTLESNDRVSVVSTYQLRDWCREAGVPYAKGVLRFCLGQLIVTEWNLRYHPETVGCLLDYNENRRDAVVGLTHMVFDHKKCRGKVRDPDQLRGIDALLSTDLPAIPD